MWTKESGSLIYLIQSLGIIRPLYRLTIVLPMIQRGIKHKSILGGCVNIRRKVYTIIFLPNINRAELHTILKIKSNVENFDLNGKVE